MTYDTFDSYNTDEAYKDKGTTAKGLVAAYKKDNPNGTAEDFYSKLNKTWAQDKDGHVKNAVAEAFTIEEQKKEEPKPEEEPVEEFIEEDKPEEKDNKLTAPSLSKGDKNYINDQRNRSENAEIAELNKISGRSDYNYKSLYDTTSKMSDAYKNIDDKLVAQLPTFMFKRFADGEFGDPKSSDAKLRLAHFMLNGVQSKLKLASNLSMANAGKSPMFSDTQSDWEKYQQSNLAKGLENRWKKYEAETENAIQLASKESMTEQEARHTVEQLTRTQNMNTMWNTMDENQKLYAMEVTKKIGDYIGNMDISELANYIAGAAYEGKMDKDKVVAIGIAKLAENYPDIVDKIKDGSMKDMVMSFIGTGATAGIGGAKTDSNGNQTNITGNIQNYKTIGGDEVSFDFSDPKAGEKIQSVYDDLIKRYKDGEIDEATFKEYYDPMYAESKKHPGSFKTFFSSGSDKAIQKANSEVRVELDTALSELNKKAKDGDITPSAYKKLFDEYKTKAEKYGASKKELDAITKSMVSDEKILKAADKKAKAKKK